MRLLVIEDDKQMAATLKDVLKGCGATDLAYSAEDGEFYIQENKYNVIILDCLLPDRDGVSLCKKIRADGCKTPVLMLTVEAEPERKIRALNNGVDDYLTKPFHSEELIARIRALCRRSKVFYQEDILSVEDLVINILARTVKRSGKAINLRRKEFNLLEYLVRSRGKVMTRTMIMEHVWDSDSDSIANVVDVHINYLRDKIDKPFDKKLIKTVHGLGYKIEA